MCCEQVKRTQLLLLFGMDVNYCNLYVHINEFKYPIEQHQLHINIIMEIKRNAVCSIFLMEIGIFT